MTTRTPGGIYSSTNIWAENGQKDEPSFTESTGWDITYSQAGGNVVERTLMNRNFNKVSAALYDVNRFGANLAWSALVNYEIGAKVIGSDTKVYKAKTLNINIDPVSDNGTNWKYDEKPYSSDANINIVEDNRGNTAFSLTSNLSDKADKTLNNVTVGDLLGKFSSTDQITFSASGSNIKATFNSRNAVDVTALTTNLTAADANKTYYVAATGSSPNTKVFNLPAASSVDDNWKIWVNAVKFDLGALSFFPNGTDKLSKDGLEGNVEVRMQQVAGALYCIYKLAGSDVFVIAGNDKGDKEGIVANSSDTILGRQDNGTIIFQNNTSATVGNITLPVANTVPDNWSCKICIVVQTASSQIKVSTGSGDKILRSGTIVDYMQIHAGTEGSMLEVFKIPGTAQFVVSGTLGNSS